MLYKKNTKASLSEKLFQQPTSEYRGAPFWSWNCKPEKGMMERQMKAFQEMGFGGYHIHSRTGLNVPYLSDEFMEDVKFCTEYAKDNELLMWAYDEDRFPSGFAGGLVTKEKKYRYRELFLTFDKREDYLLTRPNEKAEESYLIALFDIVLNEDGTLGSYQIIDNESQAEGVCWYAYLRVATEDSWFNNQTYVDTLDQDSIKRFVEVTHERYKEVVGDYFGTVIPSFFTDEPKTTYKKTLPFAKERRNLILPWTDNFPDTFSEKYGINIIEHIPELVWQLPKQVVSQARYYYHRHVAERFTESYSKTISDWCEANGVHLTGHMIKEPSLKSQSTAIGETMLPLSEFGIPGIDMLSDEREYTTAKQAQSVAHQYGREGVISELYGVTNWDFDFRRHKLGGDWQAALGVTIRVPHLSWMTMEGEAKRDYPASIHYQSPWYQEYKLIEDYFARVHTALTRGKAVSRIGFLHPVESYWLNWADEEHTAAIRKQLDENFQNLTEWLLFDHLDFDYLSESILERIGGVEGASLKAGEMKYDVVVIPAVQTLRSTTVSCLEQFVANGGQVVFAGAVPELVDAAPSDRVQKLAEQCTCVSMERAAILSALEPYRVVRIVDKNGSECNKMLCQVRQDGDCKWIFVVYGKKKPRYDIEGASTMIIRIKGSYDGMVYDAMSGSIYPAETFHEGEETVVRYSYCIHDSLLLQLRPSENNTEKQTDVRMEQAADQEKVPAVWKEPFAPVAVALDEPNVYLLDLAEYAVDHDEYHEQEEILRIGTAMREQYGITAQSGRMAQPWTSSRQQPQHILHLRYVIHSEVDVAQPRLALEHAAETVIRFNGQRVASVVNGYYVDEKIQTVSLPPVVTGENILELDLPFGEGTDVENSFLLGDFGVRLQGVKQIITSPVKTLAFGDIVPQGLPFYGGNITYELQVETTNQLTVRTPYFRGSLIGVDVDGMREGTIAFAPYTCSLPVRAGTHTLGLKLFGNRINTFGCLHNCNENCTWFGPDAWRTKGDSFSYEYQLKRVGILKAPEIK